MNIEKFDVVEVNGNKFIVLSKVTYNSNIYLYLMNDNEDNDEVAIVKVLENENGYEFIEIEDDKEFDIVMDKLIIENQDEIKELFSD